VQEKDQAERLKTGVYPKISFKNEALYGLVIVVFLHGLIDTMATILPQVGLAEIRRLLRARRGLL
jgi:uncharacterized membrane protein YagU involved in acid resistance